MNKWFNIKRFWLVLRHEFGDAWVEIAIFVGILLVFSIGPSAFFRGGHDAAGFGASLITGTAVVLYYWVLASRLFANIQKTERRIGYLTLPASNAEKFYARLLLYWLLPTAIFFFPYPNSGMHTDIYVAHIILSLLIVEASLAVLFGTIFRRFGLLVLILVEVVVIEAIAVYVAANERTLDMAWTMPLIDFWDSMEPGEGRIQKVAAWCTAVPTVLNIALARIIFSRKRLRRPLVNSEI
jgi:hypothetical protein